MQIAFYSSNANIMAKVCDATEQVLGKKALRGAL
jgi:hypothetical protein